MYELTRRYRFQGCISWVILFSVWRLKRRRLRRFKGKIGKNRRRLHFLTAKKRESTLRNLDFNEISVLVVEKIETTCLLFRLCGRRLNIFHHPARIPQSYAPPIVPCLAGVKCGSLSPTTRYPLPKIGCGAARKARRDLPADRSCARSLCLVRQRLLLLLTTCRYLPWLIRIRRIH